MYLSHLHLTHARLFAQDRLPFVSGDGLPRMFTVILAENGHAKSTVLQAIALVAAGVGGSNKLVANAASFFDKRFKPTPAQVEVREDRVEIQGDFSVSDSLHANREYPGFAERPAAAPEVRSVLYAPEGWKLFEGHSEYGPGLPMSGRVLDAVRARDLPCWFVAGYGPTRALPQSQAAEESGNRSIDRLRSLFRPEPLIATGFADVLEKQFGPAAARAYASTLRDVLVGNGSECPGLLPRSGSVVVEDMELRGQGGVRRSGDLLDSERFVLRLGTTTIKLPAVWLSAGYQSTIAWIADLIGQVALEAGEVIPPHRIEGLVLIDEIDLHLHPRWQATLVPALRATFPLVQFVATTHSPMILPGLRPGEVMMLKVDEAGSVHCTIPDEDPRLLTAAQLYREFFGVAELFPSELGAKLRRYGLLAAVAARTDPEQAELEALGRDLRAHAIEPGEPEPRTLPTSSGG